MAWYAVSFVQVDTNYRSSRDTSDKQQWEFSAPLGKAIEVADSYGVESAAPDQQAQTEE